MAGTQPGFDPTVFRSAIRFVYNMAAPPVSNEQAAFYKASELVYNVPVDNENVPFNPTTTVQRVQSAAIKVPCGIEYFDAEGQSVPFGTLTISEISVTLLDEDYLQVKDCAYVVVGGDRYNYRRTLPPGGLFDVGLYTIRFRAENDL